MRPRLNSAPFAAEREHLRHEGHPFQASVLIQGLEDLFPAPNFDPVAAA
jgi:hypothetical protein